MIVDDKEELDVIFDYMKDKTVLLVPILSDQKLHPSINNISCIYIYTEDDVERIVPMQHTEQIRGFKDQLTRFLNLRSIFVHDKKIWLQMGGNDAVYDVKSLWWYTYNESYDENYYYTSAHHFYWRRHTKLNHINAVVPLMQHLEMCQKIRKYAWPMIINSKLTTSFNQFNSIYPKVFAEIESNGMQVTRSFKMNDLITNDRVYSQYHYHTTTGRPSNAFRGFNFAAMNKEDGTRDSFCSRFENGALIEMDFDAYHIRLIARLIRYNLPITSVHQYFGKQYFGKEDLTDEEYEKSKQITFRLLYGGIDKEFLSIPFFGEVNKYISELWTNWKNQGVIYTPIERRPINSNIFPDLTKNKLFNYYLQALETEFSVRRMMQVQNTLKDYKTKLILYTYDSLLFDVPVTEAKEVLIKVKNILQGGDFPVKCKVGNIYSKMNNISL